MLNPGTVSRLRSAIRSNTELTDFEGFHVARRPVEAVALSSASRDACIAGESIRLRRPSNIFGEPIDRSVLNGVIDQEIMVPAKQLFRCQNATIIGSSAVISKEGQLLSTDPAETPEELDWALARNRENHQGFVLEKLDNAKVFAYFIARLEKKYIKKRALFFHNAEPGNFGSFLFRQLPQLLLARELDVSCDVYVVPDRTPWWTEAMACVGLPERPVFTVREVSGDVFDEVLCTNKFDAEGLMAPSTIAQFQRLGIAPEVGISDRKQRPERLYISRELNCIARPSYRPLVNEDQIQEICKEMGFFIVHPETLTMKQQIEIFRFARCIVGPSGSGMLNSLFCLPGAKILDMESFTYTVRQHAKIYSSGGHDYSFAFGTLDVSDERANWVRRWSMPLSVFSRALDWVLEK